MNKNPYGETKLRICSGTLAKLGKDNFRLELVPVPEADKTEADKTEADKNKVAVNAHYIDSTGKEQALAPCEITKVIPVAMRSAYENPRDWIFPGLVLATTWIGGPMALNYIYLKVTESVFLIAFTSVAAAQTASVFYAGAALNRNIARAVVETTKGYAVIEGSPLHIGLLAGLTHTQADE